MFTSLSMRLRFAGLLIVGLLISTLAIASDDQSGQGDQKKSQMLELWSPGDTGQRMRIRGRVASADGKPLPNVRIRVRHADAEGMDWSYYQGTLSSNERGVYQFGSVIPGNSHRLSHVHVYVDHPGFQYLDTEFYFKDDPKANPDNANAIFLEESLVNGEKMMYGRWDIILTPK